MRMEIPKLPEEYIRVDFVDRMSTKIHTHGGIKVEILPGQNFHDTQNLLTGLGYPVFYLALSVLGSGYVIFSSVENSETE